MGLGIFESIVYGRDDNEIVAAPTGYIMQIEDDKRDKKQAELNFIRKIAPPLIGSEVQSTKQRCYTEICMLYSKRK